MRTTAMVLRRSREGLANLASWITHNAQTIGAPHRSLTDTVRVSLEHFIRISDRLDRAPAFGVVPLGGGGAPWLVDSIVAELLRPSRNTTDDGGPPDMYRVLRHAPSGNSVCFRFAANESTSDSSGFPYRLELLSLFEVAAILSASYHLTGASSQKVLSAQLIADACDAAEKSAVAWTVAGLPRADVEVLRDIVEARFPVSADLGLLAAAGYWERLSELAENLPDVERANLLALLWGRDDDYTAAFQASTDALTVLGFAGQVQCSSEALVERSARTGWMERHPRSVLASRTIEDLGLTALDVVTVLDRLGREQLIARSALALLARELVVPMPGQGGWAGVKKPEIVEFPKPGTLDAGDLVKMPSAAGAGRASFGKFRAIAHCKTIYLLERAIRHFELSALVLVVDPATERVEAFDDAIADWVEQNMGAEPAMRERSPGALLAVATKADDPILRPAAAAASMAHWSAGLEQLVNRSDPEDAPWPSEWTPGRGFSNIYMFQHPARQVDAMSASELAPTSRAASGRRMVQALRSAKYGAELEDSEIELLETHLSAPTAGAGLIISRLRQLGTPQSRSRQVARRVAQVDAGVRARIVRHEAFGLLPDIEDWRRDVASVLEHRLRTIAEAGRLGHLLQALMVREGDLEAVIVKSLRAAAHRAAGRSVEREGWSSDVAPFQQVADSEPLSETSIEEIVIDGLSFWMLSLRRVARSPGLAGSLRTSRAVIAHVVDEMLVGAVRLGLQEAIVARLATMTPRPQRSSVSLLAAIVASVINDFVQRLTIGDGSSTQRKPTQGFDRGDSASQMLVPDIETLSIAKGWRYAFGELAQANIAAAGDIQWLRKDAALSSILETASSNRLEFDL